MRGRKREKIKGERRKTRTRNKERKRQRDIEERYGTLSREHVFHVARCATHQFARGSMHVRIALLFVSWRDSQETCCCCCCCCYCYCCPHHCAREITLEDRCVSYRSYSRNANQSAIRDQQYVFVELLVRGFFRIASWFRSSGWRRFRRVEEWLMQRIFRATAMNN